MLRLIARAGSLVSQTSSAKNQNTTLHLPPRLPLPPTTSAAPGLLGLTGGKGQEDEEPSISG